MGQATVHVCILCGKVIPYPSTLKERDLHMDNHKRDGFIQISDSAADHTKADFIDIFEFEFKGGVLGQLQKTMFETYVWEGEDDDS